MISTIPLYCLLKEGYCKRQVPAYGLAQMTQLLISLPFAILRLRVLPAVTAGIEANLAYYGFGFIIYAIFNFIFLTEFSKPPIR